MSRKPQDYISSRGRMTTNTVEAFHGLALLYRGKRTDLEHVHYTCKTNMAICHKVTYMYNMLVYMFSLPCMILIFFVEYWSHLEDSVLHEDGRASAITCCTGSPKRTKKVGEEQRETINKKLHSFPVQ